jgi:DNA-directed RNA polymerase specialized sigma24 family protein
MQSEQTIEFSDLQILKLREGDESGLRYVEQHMARRMKRTALQITSNEQIAEDAVATALARVWKKRALLPKTWAEASRYMLAIVHSCTIDLIRVRAEQVQRCELDEARYVEAKQEDVDPDGYFDQAIGIVERRLMPKLMKRHHKVLSAVAMGIEESPESMSEIYARVAREQQMSAGAVRNSWASAGQQLQEVLISLGWEDFTEEEVRLLLSKIGRRQESVTISRYSVPA